MGRRKRVSYSVKKVMVDDKNTGVKYVVSAIVYSNGYRIYKNKIKPKTWIIEEDNNGTWNKIKEVHGFKDDAIELYNQKYAEQEKTLFEGEREPDTDKRESSSIEEMIKEIVEDNKKTRRMIGHLIKKIGGKPVNEPKEVEDSKKRKTRSDKSNVIRKYNVSYHDTPSGNISYIKHGNRIIYRGITKYARLVMDLLLTYKDMHGFHEKIVELIAVTMRDMHTEIENEVSKWKKRNT